MVYTVYIQRRRGYDVEAKALLNDIRSNLLIGLDSVRCFNRFFVDFIERDVFERAVCTVFSEPQTDIVYFNYDNIEQTPFDKSDNTERILAVEYLPGQYDQRADSCEQCIQILADGTRPKIRTAKIYTFSGEISDSEFDCIRRYIINPVECREASLDVPDTLEEIYDEPPKVEVLDGFTDLRDTELPAFISEYGLAMGADDAAFCQNHFKTEEKRNPTMTELRLLDAYWSDHCRHTTFLTSLDNIEIDDPNIAAVFDDYRQKRGVVYENRKRDITLMDIATIAAKYFKKSGKLDGLDESEEINACSVKIKVKTHDGDEDWLLMFKNETHNHPTEIEPFGGAATCLGGAIRDPLSGRSYVYQAMRVTGAGDPRTAVSDTLPGKLPQSRLTVTAANGYSSYGNQIGVATGGVSEIYHPGYIAKRMELGAVIGAAPAANVVRLQPEDGDAVILLGGRTGRDGCGGAAGSSRAHTSDSLATCGAEVQKGNALIERNIQRLFRNKEVTRLIKRCNDFGAGGVSVAIGELADGLDIDLSRVPKKYEGLDGTELAISESQERMAVVVAKEDADAFIAYAKKENLEATVVARVTAEPRLRMRWKGDTIVNLSRTFLNSNGAKKQAAIKVNRRNTAAIYAGLSAKLPFEAGIEAAFYAMIADLNVCSQKGLSERFDSSVGASTVVMPFGGRHQLTSPQYMAAKIPLGDGETDTSSVMAYGFNPYLSEIDPFTGAYCAVIESLARLTAAGISYKNAYLSFQEYFESLRDDPRRWGKPFSALLGAYKAQTDLGVASIGGKDSMSGSFEDMDVPPTLVSFAVAVGDAAAMVTPEFKRAGSAVWLVQPEINPDTMLPDAVSLRRVFEYTASLAKQNRLYSAYAVGFGGAAEGLVKMCFGNGMGFDFTGEFDSGNIEKLFAYNYGALIIETDDTPEGILLGYTTDKSQITLGDCAMPIDKLERAWSDTLEGVFPTLPADAESGTVRAFNCTERSPVTAAERFARPRVIIPVFPGTNSEYDTARAVIRAGGIAETFVLRNLTPDQLSESIAELAALTDRAQIMILSGGFSGGDGSGKFITAILRSPRIREAITRLLDDRGGLMLGICNGFQALVKSGLLPYGKITDHMTSDCPTLTFNAIKRHQSMMVTTRVSSVKSPWFNLCEAGQLHTIPISHGEGRFIASETLIEELAVQGRITTQYVNADGRPTMETRYNPNGSVYAIESIVSADGRILGKMGHSERIGNNVAKNIPGDKDQRLFEAGVGFFM
ncbi:MAG: phosphoribosylformylglycinamidine synthase [Eubacteriales bacterium]|nr:phosphoribosylformylglycinamidine synthase [Eubacteriales bacterium]